MIDLSIIKSRFGGGLTRSQLVSLLHDLYPTDKRDVNLAIIVYDSGIASKISSMKNISSVQLHVFTKQLVDGYGLQEIFAKDGIRMWASIYGTVKDTSVSHKRALRSLPNKSDNSKIGSSPLEIVIDSCGNYELSNAGQDKVIIKKFFGIDDSHMVVPNMIDGKQVTGIAKEAFMRCRNIETLTISDGIETIGERAFFGCSFIKQINFPDTLREVDQYAFYGVNRLETLLLPNSITHIGPRAFGGCRALNKVVIPEELTIIEKEAFCGLTKLKTIVFPNALKVIGKLAFGSCRSLDKILLPEKLETIEKEAFAHCSNLKKVLLPGSVTKIANDSFDRDTTFYCYPGTYALKFAREHGYNLKHANDYNND